MPFGSASMATAHPAASTAPPIRPRAKPPARIPAIAPCWWLAWPLGYAAYALLRGAATGFYPYPFVDVPSLGMGRVLGNVAGLCIVFLATGFLLRALAHARQRPA